MTAYYIVYSIIILTEFFIPYVIKDKNKKNIIVSWICFFILMLLFSLRHQSMGVDLGYGARNGYLGSFDIIAQKSWKQVVELESYLNYEKGFVLLNKLISSIVNHRQFYLACCAFISIFPISYIIKKKSKIPTLSYLIYMGLPVFLILFSGLRQAIAIGICFYALKYLEDKKIFKFAITVFIATMFHASARVFFIAYPLYYLKLNNSGKVVSVLLIPVVYIFRYQLFNVLSKIFRNELIATDTGAITLLIIFTLIYIFCLIFVKNDIKTNGYRNLFYIACICQVFSGLYSIAMRMGYYFMIVLILLLPAVICEFTGKKDRTLITCIIASCFLIFGLYSLSKISWAMTNPYILFWK